MLYTAGVLDSALNINAYKGVKKEYSKALPKMKSLNQDTCCFSGATNLNGIENISFGRKTPKQTITPHDNPYVLVHGTLAKEDTLFGLRNFLKSQVHSIDLTSYPMITKGDPIEVSVQEVSKNVNKSRIAVAKEKLEELKNIKDDPRQLRSHFGIYQSGKDYDTGKLVKLIPDVIKDIEAITKRDQKDLLESFSTRVKAVEQKLSDQIKKTGFGNWDKANKDKLCNKAAEEIIEAIAPKAVLVGHSMGGLVVHAMVLHPKKVDFNHKGELKDKDPMTFDAGNGVGLSIGMESPLENGVNLDSRGMRDARYDWCNETIIKPVEKAWGGLLSFCFPWLMGKAMFKQNCENFSYENDIKPSQNPEVVKKFPSTEQMIKDSDFYKKYVIGHHAPEGVSSLSYYHTDDKFLDLDAAKLNESHANNHNIRINFDITDDILHKARNNLSVSEAMTAVMQMLGGQGLKLTEEQKMIKSLYAHNILSFQPQEFRKSFEEVVSNNPNEAIKMLDLSNSDNLRRQCLDVIYKKVMNEPDFLNNKARLLEKIKQVSAEKVPFENSPSYRADQILGISE
jgi:hypothetical protein